MKKIKPKIKFAIFLSITLLLMVNCANPTSTTQQNSVIIESDTIIFVEKVDEKIEIDTIVLAGKYEEDFRTFLEKFGTDSVFQVSRIVFPLEIIEFAWTYDDFGNFWIDTDSVETSMISLENHRFVGLLSPNFTGLQIEGDADFINSYIERVFREWDNNETFPSAARTITRISENKYFVHFFALEQCGREGFYFQKNEYGKWYLVKIDAKSM